jgi:hypothetical protein
MLAVWRSVGSVVVLLNEKTFLSFSRTLRVTNVSPSGQPLGYYSSWPVFEKVVNLRSLPYPITIFQRLLVSKTGVSTKSLISSGLLVNALLKQSSQHAHIMICQRSSANGRSRQG